MIGVLSPSKSCCPAVRELHFDQVEQLFVVNHIALVQEHNDLGHANLTSQQDVLTGLRHRAIGCSNNQDSAVHLSSTGDHVLDVVSMARAVNVGIVSFAVWYST